MCGAGGHTQGAAAPSVPRAAPQQGSARWAAISGPSAQQAWQPAAAPFTYTRQHFQLCRDPACPLGVVAFLSLTPRPHNGQQGPGRGGRGSWILPTTQAVWATPYPLNTRGGQRRAGGGSAHIYQGGSSRQGPDSQTHKRGADASSGVCGQQGRRGEDP